MAHITILPRFGLAYNCGKYFLLENKRRVGKQIICACRFHFLNKKILDFFGDDDDGDDDGDDDAIALQYNDLT